jgi:hypothetical protein
VSDQVGSLKKLIGSEDFCNQHKKQPQDFTRNRASPFKVVLLPVPLLEQFKGTTGDYRGTTGTGEFGDVHWFIGTKYVNLFFNGRYILKSLEKTPPRVV